TSQEGHLSLGCTIPAIALLNLRCKSLIQHGARTGLALVRRGHTELFLPPCFSLNPLPQFETESPWTGRSRDGLAGGSRLKVGFPFPAAAQVQRTRKRARRRYGRFELVSRRRRSSAVHPAS